ncbi:hypothetical protein [Streptomyces hydrogenans]|uniref:hypothetical protein n=1 Tax=Streptomyces hydrogenans TaxID=1873719 RepID=UPI0033BD7618
MLGETALVPLGYVLAGTVADRLGPSRVLWICCAGITVATLVLLLVPGVRRLTALTEPEEDGEKERIAA